MRKALATLAAVTLASTIAAPADAVVRLRDSHHRPILETGVHGVVQMNRLPHCKWDDGGENQPCTWNIGRRIDGNGRGLSYWIGKHDRVHYVWATSPVGHNGWRWMPRDWQRAMADSTVPSEARRNWNKCALRIGDTTWIKCPDGSRYSS